VGRHSEPVGDLLASHRNPSDDQLSEDRSTLMVDCVADALGGVDGCPRIAIANMAAGPIKFRL
jgi:hypothetical protein